MDFGSVEDLLRPASLVERKQRLGLLDVAPSSPSSNTLINATTSTATKTTSSVSTSADSRSVGKEKSATAQNRHSLSPNLKKSKPPSSINKASNKSFPPKAQQRKRVRMENRPPLAPKPDSLREPPPPPPTSSSTAAGAPVPRPRKRPGAPPPTKPMPYRKHVELKDKEVSTFKSSAPVAPPRVRKRPAVPTAKPSPPSHRLSIPGEPSDLFQPKSESKAPVQCAIPQVPKQPQKPSAITTSSVIDTRPRLDTPQVVPDPDDIIGFNKQIGAVPIESRGTPSSYHSTTQSSNVNGIAGGSNDEFKDQQEMYTEAYAHVESEENDAEYAVVSPSRTAVVPSPQSLSSSVTPATGKSSPRPPLPPPPRSRGGPPSTPPIAQLRRSPSPILPSPTPLTSGSAGPSWDRPTVDSSIDDHEYNITSHVQDRVKKRSLGTPPIPPPIAPPIVRSRSPPQAQPPHAVDNVDDHKYNTTSHVKDRIRKRTPPVPPPTAPPTITPRSTKSSPPPLAQLSAEEDEYSVLDHPDKKPGAVSPVPVVQPSSESEEYSVLSGEADVINRLQVSESEEYSMLASEPQVVPSTCTIPGEAEGYERLDLDAISASNVADSENTGGDSSVYEEIRSESSDHNSKTSGIDPSPTSPPTRPQMDKHPRVLARKASDKFKDEGIEATVLSSRDRSKLPAAQQPSMEESGGEKGERGGARLPPRNRAPPPIPHSKRQKKMPPRQNSDEAATPTSTCISSSESASIGNINGKAEVPLSVLERAGYETRNTFSPPPEDMELERKEQISPQIKPSTPTRRISPVPAKVRGPKPPPLPKPKEISLPTPQRAAKMTTSGEQELTKGDKSTPVTSTEGHSVDHEAVHMSGDPSSMEAVDGSCDSHMTGMHEVKIELDVDHIMQVGSALVDYQLESMAEALYDNHMIVNAVSQGDTSAEQQKRASRSSYENQVVVDMVQQGNDVADSNTEQSDAMVGTSGNQMSLEQNLQQNSQETEIKVCEYGEEDQIMESTNDDDDDSCTKLTPSDIFTVPQHAIPGHLDYCDIDVSRTGKNISSGEHQIPAIALAQSQHLGEGGGGEGGGDDSGTFVVQPHAYPDSHGYCDIELREPSPSRSTAAAMTQPDSVSTTTAETTDGAGETVTDEQGYCDIDIQPPPHTSDNSTVPQANDSEIVTDARGYCDIDVLPPPTDSNSAPPQAKGSDATKKDLSTADEVMMDAQGYCDIDIKTPPPKSGSHAYEIVPETAKQKNAASKSGSKSTPPSVGKAPPIPSSRPGSKPAQDRAQEDAGKASNKGVPPKRPPPRRRAPPPPPLKSKTAEELSEKSPQSSPLGNELVISTGLATLPRSPKKQPPKRPPPFATTSPLLSKKMSPLAGKKLDLKPSPLPSSSPLSSPVPPGSPKSLDLTNEQPQSSGLKKKFKGLFKQKQTASSAGEASNAASNSSSSGGLVRRPSWGRKKKTKAINSSPSPSPSQDNGGAQLSPSTKSRSLPGYALHRSQPQGAGPPPPNLQLQSACSYDADQEDEDEFGIYSTIKEDKMKPSSAETKVTGATAAAVASPDDLKDDRDIDEGGYDVVDKKVRSTSISAKKKKKSGKKGFEMRKASSVEHLYETADFNNDVKMPKSARNSPQIPRKPPELGDHAAAGPAAGPAASPALPLPNRNFLAGPPNLDELKKGVDPSQLYAQVVASPKQPPKKQKSDDLSEKESADSAGAAQQAGETGSADTEEAVASATGGMLDEEGDHVPEQLKEKDRLVATLVDESPSPEHVASTEIKHTKEGEDVYAVVSAELKKKARKRKTKSSEKGKTDSTPGPPTVQTTTTSESGEGSTPRGRNLGKKVPPKPPKSYQEHISSSPSGRVSPMAMFATSAADGKNRSPPAVFGAATSSSRNLSPPPVDIALGLTPQERTRVASFSSGPPSFPPPPPPKSVSPEPIVEDEGRENPYNIVDEVKIKPKRKAPPAPGGRKPPPPRAQNGSLGEDESGYEVVKNDKRTGRKKEPQRDKPSMVHIDKVSKPHLSPDQRAPHVYTTFEVVEDESGEMKGKEGSITVPVKTPAAGYATVSHSAKRVTLPTSLAKRDVQPPPGRLLKNPKLSPKSRPPPPPPGQRRPGDSSTLPSTSHPLSKQLASPMTGDSPSVAEDQIGKRIFVSMENSPTSDSTGVAEPKFLFSHAQKFIEVGDADNIPPVATPPSVVTNSYEEEDSDGELLDSTDWETSSGGEEAEEQEREQSPEPKEAQPKTFYIAREILTTERTFVKGLTLIDKDFRKAMRSANNAHEKPVVTEEGLKAILGNVSSLLTLNSGLLQELEERMAQWSTNPRIGDILLSRAPYLKLYTEYISRFDKALKTLEEFTKKNPVFAQVLKEFESQPKCANIPLAGYMLDIVQRITRYKLLLADYVKHLPDDSPDKDTSQKALVIISSVATHVNETVRQMDNFRKVCDVRKRLIGDSGDTLITPHRKLLKEGELMKFSRKEKQPRMFFLFNDILIYASSIPPANTTYKVIKRIPLDGMRVEHLDDPEMRYGFQIISTCKSFRLEASNREELHQWFTAFEVAIKENSDRKKIAEPKVVEETDSSIPLGSLAPPWLPDSAVSMCQLCSAHFTVTRRRHHCRACGKIFCSECSSYLAPLKYKNNKLGRVCQVCYETLPKNEDAVMSKKTSLQRATKSRVSLPSVLREVKARDQSAQVSGYLLARNAKSRRWKKRWFVVYNLVLYEFERHEDVSAKRSITLPSYQVAKHESDPLVFVLNHPGTGKEYFKEDSPEQVDRWIEVLQKAVLGEIEEEEEPVEDSGKGGVELQEEEGEEEEDDDDDTGEDSSPSHHPPLDTPSDTTSEAGQSPSKESSLSQEQPHPVIMEGDEETNS